MALYGGFYPPLVNTDILFFFFDDDLELDTIWQFDFPISLDPLPDAVLELDDGGFLIAAHWTTNQAFGTIRIDSTGNVVWQKPIFPFGALTLEVTQIIVSPHGEYFVFGYTSSASPFFIHIDADGEEITTKIFSQYDGFSTLGVCSQDSTLILICGSYIFKTDYSG